MFSIPYTVIYIPTTDFISGRLYFRLPLHLRLPYDYTGPILTVHQNLPLSGPSIWLLRKVTQSPSSRDEDRDAAEEMEALSCLLHTAVSVPMGKAITKLDDNCCHKPQNTEREQTTTKPAWLQHLHGESRNGRVSDATGNMSPPKSLVDTHWKAQWAHLRPVAESRETQGSRWAQGAHDKEWKGWISLGYRKSTEINTLNTKILMQDKAQQ